MAETAFDRTERGLGSADLSIPDIVARTKGNPQDIMKLVMNGQINVTQGLLAKRLSDSVVAERNAMAAQQPSVLQEQFPEMAQATGGLGAMPQAAPPMPAQMGPQMGAPAPQGMPPAQGGIGGLDFAPTQMAGGGIVGYNGGGGVAKELEYYRGLEEANRERQKARREANTRDIKNFFGNIRFRTPEEVRSENEGRQAQRDLVRLRQLYGPMPSDDVPATPAAIELNEVAEGVPTPTPTPTRTPASTAAPSGTPTRTSAPRTPTRGGSTSGARSSSPFSPELFVPSKLDAAGSLEGVREALPQRTAAMDAYMAKLAEGVDPEKARKRAEIAGLLAGLGSVEAGMTPMEALVSGFVGGGKQIQQAEKDMEAKEMELLKAQVDVEQLRNKMDADQFGLAMQIAQANMQGADAATARMLQVELAKYTAAERRQIAAAANALGYAQLNQRRAEDEKRYKLDLFEAISGGRPSVSSFFNPPPQVSDTGGTDNLQLARDLGLIPEPNDEDFEVVERR